MKRTLSALTMLALLFWSRIASAQAPDSDCGGTRAEVEILAASDFVYCGYVTTESVARVRVVRTTSGPTRQGTFLAAVLCQPEELFVGTVYEACILDAPLLPAGAGMRMDRFTDDPSPRIPMLILRRSSRAPIQTPAPPRSGPAPRTIAPSRSREVD